MSLAPAASKQQTLLKLRTSILQKAIQSRRSFRELSTRADRLECGQVESSSAESIAVFFLNKPQEAIEARLRHQFCVRRFTFRHLVHLLRFSAYCTWRASLICGSLFKNVLDAKHFIARIEIILQSPSCHSQLRDLLISLGELHNLFSEDTVTRIAQAKLLLKDAEADLTVYVEKARVRAISGLSAFRRRAKYTVLACTPVALPSKAILSNKLFACGGLRLPEGGNVTPMHVAEDLVLASPGFGTPRDVFGTQRDLVDTPGDVSGNLPSSKQSFPFSALHKLHVQLHQMQVNVHAVILMFDTLMPLLSGTHNQGVGQHFMDILRDDPLMFDGVSQQIADCHARLSTHLDDVREQVLICFCYINNARDLAYAL